MVLKMWAQNAVETAVKATMSYRCFTRLKNPFSQKIPYLGYSHAVAILDTVVFDQLLN
jgi:hypothetical protein